MNTKNNESNEFEFNKALKKESMPYLNYLLVGRYLFRPAASLVVRTVYNTAITPNQLTYISFFLGILSGIFYCFGEPLYFIIAAILLQISMVFDCADGMLARSKDMCTHFGAYLDLVLDRIVDFFVFGGIVIGHFVFSGNLIFLITGIFTTALVFLEMSLYYIINNYKKRDKTGETGGVKILIIFIIFIFSLINRLDIFILGLMIGVCINIGYKVLTFLASNPKT